MAKKKFFLPRDSEKTRRKTIDELRKQDIGVEGEEKIAGGFVEVPRWLEIPGGAGEGKPDPEPDC